MCPALLLPMNCLPLLADMSLREDPGKETMTDPSPFSTLFISEAWQKMMPFPPQALKIKDLEGSFCECKIYTSSSLHLHPSLLSPFLHYMESLPEDIIETSQSSLFHKLHLDLQRPMQHQGDILVPQTSKHA